jgi:hypothetical protein
MHMLTGLLAVQAKKSRFTHILSQVSGEEGAQLQRLYDTLEVQTRT